MADARSADELTRIENILTTGQPLLPDDFGILKAIETLYPDAKRVREAYKSALIKREDWKAFAEHIRKTSEGSWSPTDRANLAKAYLRLGQFEDVIRTAKPLADSAPDDIEINGILSAGYYNIGRYDEAEVILDRLWPRILNEKRVGEMTLRGLIHARKDRKQEALEVLLMAVEVLPDNIAALNALSRIYNSLGDREKAEEFRKRNEQAQVAQTANENRAIRQVQLVYELQEKWSQKQYTEVILLARRAIEISDDRSKPVLYQYIAESYTRLGRHEDAKAALAEIERLKR